MEDDRMGSFLFIKNIFYSKPKKKEKKQKTVKLESENRLFD